MGEFYTIKWGDTLVKLASENDLESWKEIYYHEKNADLRHKRTSPDKIYPGDVAWIPDSAGDFEQKEVMVRCMRREGGRTIDIAPLRLRSADLKKS